MTQIKTNKKKKSPSATNKNGVGSREVENDSYLMIEKSVSFHLEIKTRKVVHVIPTLFQTMKASESSEILVFVCMEVNESGYSFDL